MRITFTICVAIFITCFSWLSYGVGESGDIFQSSLLTDTLAPTSNLGEQGSQSEGTSGLWHGPVLGGAPKQLVDELHAILDDPVAIVKEEKMLLDGILDSLLPQHPEYEARYRDKAKDLVCAIHQEVIKGDRSKLPNHFFHGHQGRLNAQLILRYLIKQEGWLIDRELPSRMTAEWIRRFKLGGLLGERFKGQIYDFLVFVLPDEAFDEKNRKKPHVFHPWDQTQFFGWTDELRRTAIRHHIEDHENWPIDRSLPSKVTGAWLSSQNLIGVLKHFGDICYRVLSFAYPEEAFDEKNQKKSHIFHPWDTTKFFWTDDLIRLAIRHEVEEHERWTLDATLPSKMSARWLVRVGFGGLLASRFESISANVCIFVFPELMQAGRIKEEHFRYLRVGKGVARHRHFLRLIPHKGFRVNMDRTVYYFPSHRGHLVHKFSLEYGAIYEPKNRRMVGLFDWVSDPAAKYVTITPDKIIPVPLELRAYRPSLSVDQARQKLADEAQIQVHNLPLNDQSILTDVLNQLNPGMVVDYLAKTKMTGLRAMADTQYPFALIQTHQLFDPEQFRKVLGNYNTINTQRKMISELYIRNVTGVEMGFLKDFRAQIEQQLYNANDRILNALSRALAYQNHRRDVIVVDREGLIGDVLQSQRDLGAAMRVLEAFRQGDLRFPRPRTHSDRAREYRSEIGTSPQDTLEVRLILRPIESRFGQAGIRWTITPKDPVGAGFSPEIGFRVDRDTRRSPIQAVLDLESEAFTRLGKLDRRLYPEGYHYPLKDGEQFAEARFMEKVVVLFIPSRAPSQGQPSTGNPPTRKEGVANKALEENM